MVRIAKEDLDDIEVFEVMVDVMGDGRHRIVELLKMLLGEDGYRELKDELRGDDGRTKTSDIMQWFDAEMLSLQNGSDDVKN